VTPLRLNVPQFVDMPLPAFFTIGNAALRAIEFSGAIALFWLAVAPFPATLPVGAADGDDGGALLLAARP